jgi:hypothetical protein
MRFIAGLIALAGAAGLVALAAPIDGPALLPFLFKGDGATKLKAVVWLATFGLALVLGIFAITKERMSRLHSVCTLVAFAATAFTMEIWNFIKILLQGANIQLVGLVMTIAVVLGLIGSILALIKNRANY